MALLQSKDAGGEKSRSFLSTLARKTSRRRKFVYNSTDRQSTDDEIRVSPLAPVSPSLNRFPSTASTKLPTDESGQSLSLASPMHTTSHTTLSFQQSSSKQLDSLNSSTNEWQSLALSSAENHHSIFQRPTEFVRSRSGGKSTNIETTLGSSPTQIDVRESGKSELFGLVDESALISSLEHRYSTSIATITSLTDDAVDPMDFLSCLNLLRQMRGLSRIDFSSYCFHNILLRKPAGRTKAGIADPVNDHLANLGLLPNLKMLRLACGSLTSAKFLSRLPTLEYCDLSHNKISDLTELLVECEALNSKLQLRHLDLRWNLLSETADLALQRLAIFMPDLRILDLTGCPLITSTESTLGARGESFRRLLQQVGTYLTQLDTFCGVPVETNSSLPPTREQSPIQEPQLTDSTLSIAKTNDFLPDTTILEDSSSERNVYVANDWSSKTEPPVTSTMRGCDNNQSSSSFGAAKKITGLNTSDQVHWEQRSRVWPPPPAAGVAESTFFSFAPVAGSAAPSFGSGSITENSYTFKRSPEASGHQAAGSESHSIALPPTRPSTVSEISSTEKPAQRCRVASVRQLSQVPKAADMANRESLCLPTPQTPMMMQPQTEPTSSPPTPSNAPCCKPARSLLPSRPSPAQKSEAAASPVSCSTRASYEAVCPERHSSERTVSVEAGSLRNLKLPNTDEVTRVCPRRTLRDQPDASMLEASIPKPAKTPPVSLIGVELPIDSIQKAEQFVWEDPSTRHLGSKLWSEHLRGKLGMRDPVEFGDGTSKHTLIDDDFPTLEEIQAVSQLLGETLDQCTEVEDDIRQSYDHLEQLRSELLRSLIEFSKLRGTFFACLRRLGVAFHNRHPDIPADANVFVKFGLKIAERSEAASRGLMLYVKSLRLDNHSVAQSLQSQGGRATDFFTSSSSMTQAEAIDTIASWCLQERSAEVFTSYLGTQIFCDFASIEEDPSSVTAYVSAVLKSHLPSAEMVQLEENMLSTLAALEQDIGKIIAMDQRNPPSVVADPKFSISLVQLTDAAVRLKGSHSMFIPRLLKLFLEHTKKAHDLEGLLCLHRSAVAMVAETKSRLKRLLEAAAVC